MELKAITSGLYGGVGIGDRIHYMELKEQSRTIWWQYGMKLRIHYMELKVTGSIDNKSIIFAENPLHGVESPHEIDYSLVSPPPRIHYMELKAITWS